MLGWPLEHQFVCYLKAVSSFLEQWEDDLQVHNTDITRAFFGDAVKWKILAGEKFGK